MALEPLKGARVLSEEEAAGLQLEPVTPETSVPTATETVPSNRQVGNLQPLEGAVVISEEEVESLYDEKRQAVYEVPKGVSDRQANYLLETEIDRADKGQFFGLVNLGKDFVEEFAKSGLVGGGGSDVGRDVSGNYFTGLVRGALGTGEQVGGLLTEAGEVGGAGLAIPTFIDGIRIAQALRGGGKIVPRTGFDDVLVEVGQTLTDATRSLIQELGLKPDEESPFSKLAFDLGSGTASLALSTGLLMLTKNPATVGALFGSLQKGGVYGEAREKGMGVEQASAVSSIAGGIEGAIEALGGAAFLKAVSLDKVLTRTLIRSNIEAAEEFFQQLGEGYLAKFTGLREETQAEILLQSAYAGLIGWILGAPAGATVSIAEKQGMLNKLQTEIGLSPEQAQQALRSISEKTLQNKEAQNAIIDIIMDEVGGVSLTKEERKARALEVKKEMDTQLQGIFEEAPDVGEKIRPGFENVIIRGRVDFLRGELERVFKEAEQLGKEKELRKEADTSKLKFIDTEIKSLVAEFDRLLKVIEETQKLTNEENRELSDFKTSLAKETRRLVKRTISTDQEAEQKKRIDTSKQLLKDLDAVEKEIKQRRADGKPTVALEKKAADLARRIDVEESFIADLITEENPELADENLLRFVEQVGDLAESASVKSQEANKRAELSLLKKQADGVAKEIVRLMKEARKGKAVPSVRIDQRLSELVKRSYEIEEEVSILLESGESSYVKEQDVELSSERVRALAESVLKKVEAAQKTVARLATMAERKRLKEVNKILGQISRAKINSLPHGAKALIEELQSKVKAVKTLSGLRQLNERIQQIKDQGKEQYLETKALRDALHESRKELLLKTLGFQKPEKAPVYTQATQKKDTVKQIVSAWFKTTPRLLDLFDNYQDFKGPFHQIFYDLINSAMNEEVRAIQQAQLKGLAILEKHKVSARDLARTITVDGVTVNMSEAMHIFGAMGNAENTAAIIYGNGIPLSTMERIVQLTPKRFLDAATEMIAEMGAHYGRTRLAYIEYTDGTQDLPKVLGVYIPMRRQDVDYATTDEELAADMANRTYYKKTYVERSLTKKRATDLKPKDQDKIFLGLVETYFQHSSAREHFIAMARTIKDLHRLVDDKDLKQAIKDQHGQQALESLKNHIDRVANPHAYRGDKHIQKLMSAARRSAAVVHLAYNIGVLVKQPASIARFWGETTPDALAAGIGELLSDWNGKVKMIHEKDPQMANRSFMRELDELLRIDPKNFKSLAQLRDRFGKTGFAGIVLLDQFTTHAGWLAVYTSAKKNGISEPDAIEMAQKAVLRSQPATSPKDRARIYGANPVVDLFLQFTEQPIQDWNALTHDIVGRAKMGRWGAASLGFAGLVAQSALLWVMSHARLPEDEEDAGDMLWEFFSLIPFFGTLINASRKGYDIGLPPAIELFVKKPIQIGLEIAKGSEADFGKVLDNSLYFVAGKYRIPYTAIRRAFMGVMDLSSGATEDLRRLVWSESALKK